MRNATSILHLLVLGAALSACTPVVYLPTPHQTPLLERAGQAKASARLSTGLRTGDGLDATVQLAYSPLPHLTLHGAAQGAQFALHQHAFAEAGLGMYLPVRDHMTFELLGGYGQGRLRAQGSRYLDDVTPYEVRGSYARAYAQTNLAATFPERARRQDEMTVTFGGAMRFSHVQALDFEWDRPAEPSPFEHLYAEPALFVRIGRGPLEAGWQVGFAAPLHAVDEDYDYEPVQLGVSLGLNLDQL